MTERPWDYPAEPSAPAFYRQIVARRALDALAPEMAEAILAVADSTQMLDGFCGEMPEAMRELIYDIADKLRQIGATDG